MTRIALVSFITLSVMFLCLCRGNAINSTLLSDDWTVKILNSTSTARSQVNDTIINKQFATAIPTTIHLDLLDHQKIVDPFYRDNYPKLQWVSRSYIKYSKKFSISEAQLNSQKAIELIFYGLDTYAQIVVNGKSIIKTENAFRQYVVRIQQIAQKQNILEIIFTPTYQFDEAGQKKNMMPFKYAHTRKACYQYSWDWAPEINTIGIWRDIQLRIFDQIRFQYVWARNKLISSEKAIINFASQLRLNTFKDERLSDVYKLVIQLDGEIVAEKKITQDTVYADVQIQEPQLWWPNGIGEPIIYDFQVKIMKQNQLIDLKNIPYGIRNVKVNLQNKQFQVIINGYPVYCKGSNYVPLDMLYPRLTNNKYQAKNTIKKLIEDAVESNFNMIRIWGGGQYQSDQFMQLASRNGIMIFYDFMFSDSIYPSTEQFLVNVQEQIKQQIRRARNYPALALWSGNNEILQGVQQWGWGSINYREDYKKLFEVLIRKVVEIQNPDISYIPSSPIYGVGNYDFSKGGDFHYWGVWAGGREFESYREAIGPFNSQFGTQGLPVWHTILEFTLQQDRQYSSEVLLTHQRHGSQFRQLTTYIQQYMKKSKNFQMQTYQSGVLQAYAMQVAISAQRMAKPKSYGTLYWQMNDAWPSISWSSIDYYGRWKPLQYMAKRLFPNIAIFTDYQNNIFVINDNLYAIEAEAIIRLMSFDGKIIEQQTINQIIPLDTSKKIYTLKALQSARKQNSFIYCEVWYEGKLQMKSTKFFEKFKALQLPSTTLSVRYNDENNEITLQTKYLIKNLFIDSSQRYIKLSDNYFDLIPNIPVTITLDGNNLSQIKNTLKYVSIKEATQDSELKVVINP